MKKYYEIIRELREDRDIKQQTIADLLQMDQSNYSKIEKGKQKLTIEQLVTICNYYKISADKILGIPPFDQ